MSTPLGAQYNLRFIWTICLVAAMGGLLFGFDWVVIGGAKPFFEPYFGISGNSFQQGLAISSALIGCLVGSVVAGMLSDRFGRKRLLVRLDFCSRFQPSEPRWPGVCFHSISPAGSAEWASVWPRISHRCTSPKSHPPAWR